MRIGAAVGALLAFGAVQATMIAWALRTGERPRPLEWAGIALAVGGLVVLLAGGLSAPDPLGAALMLIAGIAWGVYSLIGRSAVRPLETTAGNFARAVPFTLALSLRLRRSRPQVDAARRPAGLRFGRDRLRRRLQPVVRGAARADRDAGGRRPALGAGAGRAGRGAAARRVA